MEANLYHIEIGSAAGAEGTIATGEVSQESAVANISATLQGPWQAIDTSQTWSALSSRRELVAHQWWHIKRCRQQDEANLSTSLGLDLQYLPAGALASDGQLMNLGRALQQQEISSASSAADNSVADTPGCRTPWETFNSTAELSFWAEALQTVGFAGVHPSTITTEGSRASGCNEQLITSKGPETRIICNA